MILDSGTARCSIRLRRSPRCEVPDRDEKTIDDMEEGEVRKFATTAINARLLAKKMVPHGLSRVQDME
ncbi:hypothetical protein KL86CLO1_12952 [uncultured Eubacteriales bacterium]|uniref:Uncharacterized protein n=1 Tax=uncultured Eubacteriales bacterium TaxID=172733 RepID=A0A212KFK8_9FIRM|nr:hypothetical protein KL86CLO1_12952 [uncultured Eubacteriales bacterium]